MIPHRRALDLILLLLLSVFAQSEATAQTAEELAVISIIAESFEQGYYDEVLIVLDEFKATTETKVEHPLITGIRIVSLYYLGRFNEALGVISEYKRQHPDAEGEIHDEILSFERRLSRSKGQSDALQWVVDSASARRFSQSHYGSEPSAPVSRMINLYDEKETGFRELQTLRQKRYEAEVWIDGAEGPIYGGLAIGLGGWLVLDLAEERDVRNASNYFLIAGGAIVAWGFYKLISSQNTYAKLTEKIHVLENRLGTIDGDIQSAKMDIIALISH